MQIHSTVFDKYVLCLPYTGNTKCKHWYSTTTSCCTVTLSCFVVCMEANHFWIHQPLVIRQSKTWGRIKTREIVGNWKKEIVEREIYCLRESEGKFKLRYLVETVPNDTPNPFWLGQLYVYPHTHTIITTTFP